MKNTFQYYYADSNCPYMLDGVHLTSMRRAKLQPIAKSLGVDPEQPKNLIVGQVMQKLNALEAPAEISELIQKPKKKMTKKK